jgi:hypothetical protein
MSLQDDLRSALTPVLRDLIAEFPTVMHITRRVETLGAGNRPVSDDAFILNGEGVTGLMQPPTTRHVRQVFGREVTGDAVLTLPDDVPLLPMDKVEVVEGPYAGRTFWVTQTTPGYMAGVVTALLVLKRPTP